MLSLQLSCLVIHCLLSPLHPCRSHLFCWCWRHWWWGCIRYGDLASTSTSSGPWCILGCMYMCCVVCCVVLCVLCVCACVCVYLIVFVLLTIPDAHPSTLLSLTANLTPTSHVLTPPTPSHPAPPTIVSTIIISRLVLAWVIWNIDIRLCPTVR